MIVNNFIFIALYIKTNLEVQRHKFTPINKLNKDPA